jgi:tetratricopeptide (TPR) repeat protein
MRVLFLVSLVLILVKNTFSQNKNDSLEFQRYFDIAYKLRNTNVDSSFFWLNKCEEKAQLSGKKEWLAKVYNLKGILLYKQNNYYASIIELQKALKYTNNKDLQGKIFINLGNTLSDLHYNYSAKMYYEMAVRNFNETQNYQFLVRALMNLSAEEMNLKMVVPARNHLKLALYYAREYGYMEEEAMCLNNLSAIFVFTKQSDSASRYIYQSFNIYENLENYYGLADAYLTAIALHLDKKEFNYAKALIDLADSIIDKLKYLDGKKNITEEKVSYYLLTNDAENAYKYFNEFIVLLDSIEKNKKIDNLQNIEQSLNNNDEKSNNKSNNLLISWIQLMILILFSVVIVYFQIKNYRNVKE